MKTSTVKGTRDYLPREAELRDFMCRSVLETYRNHGYRQIITPALEDIGNLDNSDGGDNLSLMFRILKRGDKLGEALGKRQWGSLADIGLRYDLTLPLSRYFANNRSKLVLPMKCIQIGNAYRAENPQRGRYREFTQCDIDMIGLESHWAETELITTTAAALMKLGIRDFRVRINDRRILTQLFLAFGFAEAETPGLCVVFDKIDKIGVEGVGRELSEKDFDRAACGRFLEYLRTKDNSIGKCVQIIGESEYTQNIEDMIQSVNQLAEGRYSCEFDPSLVRGQGYYTGAVFEVESLAYSGSLAGGGRYDNLIGKFTGEAIPAVGFSIGFERIFDILMRQGFEIPDNKKKVALFFEDDYGAAFRTACGLREEYHVSILEKPKRLGKLLGRLQDEGYHGFCVMGDDLRITEFTAR